MMTMSWAPMMAAMMLPGAAPAIVRNARRHDGVLAAPLFTGSYFVIWLLVGLGVWLLYRPPSSVAAL
jgi:predicted metal-binding membrane protein